MKKTILVIIISTTLSGYVSAAEKRLPDGNYQLKGIDKDGIETTNIMNIDVPFNDPALPIGLACLKLETTMVVVEQLGEFVTVAECKR